MLVMLVASITGRCRPRLWAGWLHEGAAAAVQPAVGVRCLASARHVRRCSGRSPIVDIASADGTSRRRFLQLGTSAAAAAVGPRAHALEPRDVAPERVWLDMAPREVLARSEVALAEALQGWSKLTLGGGDAVRRVLGTVGTVSPVYALRLALRNLAKGDPELLEPAEDLETRLRQADFLAYSANFANTSGASCPDEGDSAEEGYVGRRQCDQMYLEKARLEVEALLRELRGLAGRLEPSGAARVGS